MLLGNGRIQYLGNRHQHFLFFHRNDDGIPQILIALDMRRNSDLMKKLRNIILQVLAYVISLGKICLCRFFPHNRH